MNNMRCYWLEHVNRILLRIEHIKFFRGRKRENESTFWELISKLTINFVSHITMTSDGMRIHIHKCESGVCSGHAWLYWRKVFICVMGRWLLVGNWTNLLIFWNQSEVYCWWFGEIRNSRWPQSSFILSFEQIRM